MHLFSNAFTQRSNLIILLLILFILGAAMLATGVKVFRQFKPAGLLTLAIGILFMLVLVYLMTLTLFFGFNS